jgi:hypothetical protein
MDRRHACSRAVAVFAALLFVVPARAGAFEPAKVVVVEVAESIERAPQLAEAVRTEAEAEMQEHDLPTEVDPAKPRKLTIEVAGEKFAYKVKLVVERDGVVDAPVEISCECTQDELLAKVREGVDGRTDALRGDAAAVPVGPSTDPPQDPPDVPYPEDDKPKPLGGMGKGGIASLVIGAAALGTGIGFVVVGEREREGDSERDVETTDFRPPGYALIGVGAAAIITGVVLLVVDRKRAKRSTAFAPWFGRGVAGVAVGGRF